MLNQEPNYAERLALDDIIKPVIGEANVEEFVKHNYQVTLPNDRHKYVDFAIITEQTKLAIEIDGYSYHAEGQIGREQFDKQLDRQNELIC